MNNELSHLTMTSGHINLSPRSDVCDEAIALLTPIIRAGGGKVPIDDGNIAIAIARAKDGATIQILCDAIPCILCALAWRPDTSSQWWDKLLEIARLSDVIAPVLRQPPAPWLGVIILPTCVLLTREQMQMMGDLERCIAWTILEQQR